MLVLMLWCACLLCTAGDSKQVAQQVADQLRIPHFHATLKPDDKLSFVTSFRNVAGRDGNGSSQPAQRPGRESCLAGHAMVIAYIILYYQPVACASASTDHEDRAL